MITPQIWIIILTIALAIMLTMNVFLQHWLRKYRNDNSILRGRLRNVNLISEDSLVYIDSPDVKPITKQIKAYTTVRDIKSLSQRGVIQ